MITRKNVAFFSLLIALVSNLNAAKIGDPAASLKIQEWVKGNAVNVTDGKGVYVVEFWATWCGPCKQTIPHLTELQKKFKAKGVTIVGVSDEEPSRVKPFVKKMAAEMDYVVACDKDGKTSKDYMEAFGQSGIPTAFVVGKEGKVLWGGHPMDGLEQVIQSVLDGKYDLAAAVKKDTVRVMLGEYHELASGGDPKAKEVGSKLLLELGSNVDELCDFAFGISANAAVKNRDFELAEKVLDAAEKASTKNDHRVLGIRSIARFESGKQEEGLKLAQSAIDATSDQSMKARYQGFLQVMKNRVSKASDAKTDTKK